MGLGAKKVVAQKKPNTKYKSQGHSRKKNMTNLPRIYDIFKKPIENKDQI